MRGRIILLVVLVLVVVGVVAAVLLLGGNGDDPETEAEATLSEEQIAQTQDALQGAENGNVGPPQGQGDPGANPQVVIALQDLPRGFQFTADQVDINNPAAAVGLIEWPVDQLSVPANAINNPEDLIGLLARTDLPREAPILLTQVVPDVQDLSRIGSDAALTVPPGLVAIAVPISPSGVSAVSFAPQPGDFVDIILSFLFVEVDETFQSRRPNFVSIITRAENGALVFSPPLEGRSEPSPLSSLGVLVIPGEVQRPRLTTQRTVERAQVIWVGNFPRDGRILGLMTPTPFDTPTPNPEEGAAQPTVPPPTVGIPSHITLAVEPQDALVLTWAIDARIPINITLRNPSDTGSTPTTAVTLQYLIDNYSVPNPPILPFALEPPITSIRLNERFLGEESFLLELSPDEGGGEEEEDN